MTIIKILNDKTIITYILSDTATLKAQHFFMYFLHTYLLMKNVHGARSQWKARVRYRAYNDLGLQAYRLR